MINETPSSSEPWVSVEQAAELMQCPARTARHRMKDGLKRVENNTGGRPRILYHVSAHPRLSEAWSALHSGQAVTPAEQLALPAAPRRSAPDDLAIAKLRAQAVREYLHLKVTFSTEEAAAIATVAGWQAKPRTSTVRISERLPSGHVRKRDISVSVGGFSISTLRHWASLYRDGAECVETLLPERKGHAGRTRTEIPEGLLDMVHALAVASPRSDLVKALGKARENWDGTFPRLHTRTWLRRLRERDPERFTETLGKKGVGDFRKAHSPDIEHDYSELSYNAEFQLDDITEDFYGHSAVDPSRIIRPYAYAIIRVATRQWVAAVACEEKITAAQVQSMLGLTFASKSGGVPARILFERGTIACGNHLEDLLTMLSVKVSRTGMDGGQVHPDALHDHEKGHPQSKGVVEANIRPHHGHNWEARAQVGSEERHTAPARLETLKRIASSYAAAGRYLILPTASEWQAMIHKALERHNNKPHTGLPTILDENGESRHMTPNEYAKHLGAQGIRVMDESILPLFFQKGERVPVTKNGFRVSNFTYGRFDEELQQFAGSTVLVYTSEELPNAAYCYELGRCVERFRPLKYGSEGKAFGLKKQIEDKKRSRYEQLVADACASGGTGIVDTIKFTANPTPDRAFEVLCPELLRARAQGVKTGTEVQRQADHREAHRFDFDRPSTPDPRPSAPKARRGMLADAEEVEGQLAALGHIPPILEQEE